MAGAADGRTCSDSGRGAGVRGQDRLSERLAMRAGERPLYLATAQALDDEMRERVRLHQQQRHKRFATLEEPLALATALKAAARAHDVILVDCLTLWISNLLGGGRDVAAAVDELAATLPQTAAARVAPRFERGRARRRSPTTRSRAPSAISPEPRMSGWRRSATRCAFHRRRPAPDTERAAPDGKRPGAAGARGLSPAKTLAMADVIGLAAGGKGRR